ncbi:MAG: DUF4359 domain-containing protein [Leptolyngbyaceae cyanobacterium SL_7_1]|nr:DUF4359 domain-containing protein [Leptolyngbyaceae cyanobacterium SL_7_1]
MKLFTVLVIAAIAGVGVAMALTNPKEAAYQDYAAQELDAYLQSNVCTKIPSLPGISVQAECATFVEDNQNEVKEFIASNTDRQNFFLLSIYKSNLSADAFLPDIISNLAPSYYTETIGVFDNFFTYKVTRQ